MISKFKNYFWGITATHVCDNLPMKKILSILKEYDNVKDASSITKKSDIFIEKDTVFSVEDATNGVIEIYFKNFHFHVKKNDREDIFQIFLKREDDAWTFEKTEEGYDFTNPTTDCVEIYYWFEIETMHGFRCIHDQYINGSWNEYVTKTITEFNKFVRDLTVENKISNAYKNYK